MKNVYKWRIVTNKYLYLTDEENVNPFILDKTTGERTYPDEVTAVTPVNEAAIGNIVSNIKTPGEYQEKFDAMIALALTDSDAKKLTFLTYDKYFNLDSDECVEEALLPKCEGYEPVFVFSAHQSEDEEVHQTFYALRDENNKTLTYNLDLAIPKGAKGDPGEPGVGCQGEPGDDGKNAVITSITADLGQTGVGVTPDARVSYTANTEDNTYKMHFIFDIPQGVQGEEGPQGPDGPAGASARLTNVTAQVVETLSPGSNASVTVNNVNYTENAESHTYDTTFNLDFKIPGGEKGNPGDPGKPAMFGDITCNVETIEAGYFDDDNVWHYNEASGTCTQSTYWDEEGRHVLDLHFDFLIPRGKDGVDASGSSGGTGDGGWTYNFKDPEFIPTPGLEQPIGDWDVDYFPYEGRADVYLQIYYPEDWGGGGGTTDIKHRYNESTDSLSEGVKHIVGINTLPFAKATGVRSHAEGIGLPEPPRYFAAEYFKDNDEFKVANQDTETGEIYDIIGLKFIYNGTVFTIVSYDEFDEEEHFDEYVIYKGVIVNNGIEDVPLTSATENFTTTIFGEIPSAGNAVGLATHTEGIATQALNAFTHAEGCGSTANGMSSHAEGTGTETLNMSEHAEGQFNKSTSEYPLVFDNTENGDGQYNTVSSVGIGTSEDDRRNAFEIMQNGDIYIKNTHNCGEYDGTNPESARTLQELLRDLEVPRSEDELIYFDRTHIDNQYHGLFTQQLMYTGGLVVDTSEDLELCKTGADTALSQVITWHKYGDSAKNSWYEYETRKIVDPSLPEFTLYGYPQDYIFNHENPDAFTGFISPSSYTQYDVTLSMGILDAKKNVGATDYIAFIPAVTYESAITKYWGLSISCHTMSDGDNHNRSRQSTYQHTISVQGWIQNNENGITTDGVSLLSTTDGNKIIEYQSAYNNNDGSHEASSMLCRVRRKGSVITAWFSDPYYTSEPEGDANHMTGEHGLHYDRPLTINLETCVVSFIDKDGNSHSQDYSSNPIVVEIFNKIKTSARKGYEQSSNPGSMFRLCNVEEMILDVTSGENKVYKFDGNRWDWAFDTNDVDNLPKITVNGNQYILNPIQVSGVAKYEWKNDDVTPNAYYTIHPVPHITSSPASETDDFAYTTPAATTQAAITNVDGIKLLPTELFVSGSRIAWNRITDKLFYNDGASVYRIARSGYREILVDGNEVLGTNEDEALNLTGGENIRLENTGGTVEISAKIPKKKNELIYYDEQKSDNGYGGLFTQQLMYADARIVESDDDWERTIDVETSAVTEYIIRLDENSVYKYDEVSGYVFDTEYSPLDLFTGSRISYNEITGKLYYSDGSNIYNISTTYVPLVFITWSDLQYIKTNERLNPGQQYRIIDFTTTVGGTASAYTQSTLHAFDIIVTADDNVTLNENVRFALPSNGENYFNNCKIESWIGKYCIDNDTTRFDWADTTNGKGIIYYMKDEWDNEAPYDFKNIQCKFDNDNTWYYSWNGYNGNTNLGDGTLTGLCKNNKMLPYINNVQRKINRITVLKNPCNNIIEQDCYNLKLTSDGVISNLMVYRGTQNVAQVIPGNITYQRVLGKRTNETDAIIANPMDFLISSVVAY